MVDYTELRHISPSIAFLFTRLRGLLDSFGDQYPQIGGFVIRDSGLDLALGDLYPFLQQSLSWFKSIHGVFRRENIGSGNQERGSFFGVVADGAVTDTATSVLPVFSVLPSTSATPHPFHALKEKCSLKVDVFNKFRDRFQFPAETRARLPLMGEKACAFAHRGVCFYEATFLCGLRFPVHPFIMELLNHLHIALMQLMPNSWRIVISCMVIWTTIADGDIITLNKFIHLYRLKESKEFRYSELIHWDKGSRLILDLPSSFRYWKSRYFFMSSDGWETLFDDFWGNVPRLLRR